MLSCSCSQDAKYIGQTRVSFRTRMSQHEADTTSNKSDEHISGISKHARHCTAGTINWNEPEIITTLNNKKKTALQQNLLVRESLVIKRRNASSNSGLNDPQLAVRSNAWDPILKKLKDWTLLKNLYSMGGGDQRDLSLSFIPFFGCLFFWWSLIGFISLSLFCLHQLPLFFSSLLSSLVIPFSNETWHSHICSKFWLSY